MRNGSPQGYSGRRSYARNGKNRRSKGETDNNIWEVVSALANALQDARNQLVNLMNTSRGTPMRVRGGRTNSYESCESRFSSTSRVSPGRTYSPYAGVRNVHRGHAHGHVAFGLNSEFPVHATPSRARPRPIPMQMSAHQQACRAEPAQASPAAGRRCTHPLHGMGAAARCLTPRRVQSQWPSSRVVDCRKSHCDQLSRRDRACVKITSERNQDKDNGNHRRHDHCIGTQFISLLKQEAHQIRERRLAEESLRDRRPSWSRC